MPSVFLGAVAVGATCGWLCGILLTPARIGWRAELVVLVALSLIVALLFGLFGWAAALGFSISTGFFHFVHAAWRIRLLIRRSI
jgi:hypothetical protein